LSEGGSWGRERRNRQAWTSRRGHACPRHGDGGAVREKKGRGARAGPHAIERERAEGLGARSWAPNGPVSTG
jgi:hypothetical protein